MQNQTWLEWWEGKMSRNLQLIQAVKQRNSDKIKDLLNENKYLDLCADVNFQEN